MSISKRLLRTLITATLLTAFLATFVPTAYTQGTTAVNRTADNLTGREPAPAAQSRFLPGDEPQPAERAETAPPGGLSSEEWASIQTLMREAQYQFTWQTREGQWAYRAPNRQHGLDLAFAPQGFTATRYSIEGEPVWDLSLSLLAYGSQNMSALPEAPVLSARKARVEYAWGGLLTEWYQNSSDGIEHGLTLNAPPAKATPGHISISYVLGGSLSPSLDEAGQVLRLRSAGGETELVYDTLVVFDAAGKRLPAHLELDTASSRYILRIAINDSGAVYPLTVDPLLYSEVQIVRASDAQLWDYFGYSVSLSGDTLAVGAYGEDGGAGDPASSSGAAYLFARNQGGADA